MDYNFLFLAWGSHWDKTDTPYLTAAAAIGMTPEDITTFIRRLDKVMASRSVIVFEIWALKQGIHEL